MIETEVGVDWMASQYLNHTRPSKMIEVGTLIVIAADSDFAVLINKLYGHIKELVRRMNKIELRMATGYRLCRQRRYQLCT